MIDCYLCHRICMNVVVEPSCFAMIVAFAHLKQALVEPALVLRMPSGGIIFGGMDFVLLQ